MTSSELSPLPVSPAENALAADADREAVAEVLRAAAGEGRIDLEELDRRIAVAYRARTYAQLRALVTDLPGSQALVLDPTGESETLVLQTKATNLKQSGPWTVPQRIRAESTVGFITLDFTKAQCKYSEIVVDAATRSGRIRLILPRGWAARVSPSSTNTAHIINDAAQTAEPGGCTVILTGRPLSGYIKVKQRRG